MKKTRIIALMLALLLMAFLLGGCSSKPEESTPVEESAAVEESASAEAPEAEVPEAEQPAEEEQPAEVIDYSKGLDFTGYPLVDEPTTLSMWVGFQTNMYAILPNGLADHSTYKKAEELTGVTIEFMHQANETASEKFNLMVASGEYPDMVSRMEYSGGFDASVADDFAIDLTPYIEEYAPNFNYLIHMDESFMKDIVTDDGNIVAFYCFNSEPSLTGKGGMIRVDWLNKLGMEKPKTYDELHDALTAFKVEFGAEEALMLPAASVPDDNCLVGGFGVSGQKTATLGMVSYPYYVVDGVVKHGLIEDGYFEYVSMIRQWMEEGLISETYLTDNDNPMGDSFTVNITTGRSGLIYNDTPMLKDYQVIGQQNDPDFIVEATYDVRKNVDDVIHLGSGNRILGNAGITITTGCENVELAVQWNDFLYSKEMTLVQNWGEEGVSYDYDENGNIYATDIMSNPPEGFRTMEMNYVYSNTTANKIEDMSKKTADYTDAQKAANDIWNTGRDADWTLPQSLALNSEESEKHSNIYSDIDTYISENLARFYVGEKPLEEWDAFIDQVLEMGLEDCIALYQAAYDRYIAK